MKKDTESAFKWIVKLLKSNNIPFQISGGFAARLYGSKRPLFDIDVDIPNELFDRLMPFVKDNVVYGPEIFRDESWDLLLMTIKYGDQEIDISGCDNMRLFNHTTKRWEACEVDTSDSNVVEVYGEKVPIIKKQKLIDYKKVIRRPTDLEDIKVLTEKV